MSTKCVKLVNEVHNVSFSHHRCLDRNVNGYWNKEDSTQPPKKSLGDPPQVLNVPSGSHPFPFQFEKDVGVKVGQKLKVFLENVIWN